MHPSAELHATKSQKLLGKRIVLGITGSIAAVEVVKLARELIRHGAEVFPVMSPASQRIIHPDSVWFACGRAPVTELDGSVQHVALCGNVPDKADMLLVAPATANTISKMAHGIDDTTVTTMATTAIGTGIPVMVVPGMHSTMYNHPILRENIKELEKTGVEFVGPVISENKAKMSSIDEIVARVIRRLSPGDLKGRRITIVSGGFSEPWDAVRQLTSIASGRTGIHLAAQAYERGADVTLLFAGESPVPPHIRTVRLRTVTELKRALDSVKPHVIIVSAAIPDYAPEIFDGKVPSDKRERLLRLRKQPKVLSHIRGRFKGILVGFKAEHSVEKAELIERARARMREHKLDMMVANDLRDVEEERTAAVIITKKAETEFKGTKEALADAILDEVARIL